MKESFFIEFIGMPGSGKSFYQNKLIKLLKNKDVISNNYRFLSKFEKSIFFLFFLLTNFKLTILNLFFFYTKKSKSNEFAKHFYYFKNEAALKFYHQIKKKIIINSEGFRHRSVYFIYENSKINKNFNFRKYLDLLPKIDLLIYIKSKKKNNIIRAKKRKNSFIYNSGEIKKYDEKLRILKKIVKESKKKNKIFYLDSDKPNLSTKELKKIIMNI